MNAGLTWLTVLAVITSLFGAFYYLRIVKLMWFDEPLDTTPLETTLSARAFLIVNGLLTLVLGMFPGPLMTLCQHTLQLSFFKL